MSSLSASMPRVACCRIAANVTLITRIVYNAYRATYFKAAARSAFFAASPTAICVNGRTPARQSRTASLAPRATSYLRQSTEQPPNVLFVKSTIAGNASPKSGASNARATIT